MPACRLATPWLLLAAMAAAPLAAMPGPKIPVYEIHGPAKALKQLIEAAAGCGYGEHVSTAPGAELDTIVEIAVPDRASPQFRCVWKWLDDHPDKGLTISRRT